MAPADQTEERLKIVRPPEVLALLRSGAEIPDMERTLIVTVMELAASEQASAAGPN